MLNYTCGIFINSHTEETMNRYLYRVYAKDRTFDTLLTCMTPSEGQFMLESQYGCSVIWMGQS